MKRITLKIRVAFLFIALSIHYTQAQSPKPNFIFIVVDDLNDYVDGFDGDPQISTPNMKALCDSGLVFLNAFCNAPGCAPSRTSFLAGKDIKYTQVYNNDDYLIPYRTNFTTAKDNAVVYTLPQMLKDSGGYFTYNINKIFHAPSESDMDKTGTGMCEKEKSWNRLTWFENTAWFDSITVADYRFGGYFDWGLIPDSLEKYMVDYMAADTAVKFISDVGNGIANTCGKPFFLGLGLRRPHSGRFIPEHYYIPGTYMNDPYEEPFLAPYNSPEGTYPPNGIVMPPQPAPMWQDYYNLPEGGVARGFADFGGEYADFMNYPFSLPSIPVIDDSLTDAERIFILQEAARANYVSTYVAAVQYVDAQIGRVIDTLKKYPAVLNNTYIILVGDHGYSLGEKRHWTKWTLWETVIRVPFIIVDPTQPGHRTSDRTVSLLDLYPTILDIAGVSYPHFPDGSPYLDGVSLAPLINNPEQVWERPVLTTYKKYSNIGSCFQHYSVRSDRFHYIKYKTNNGGEGFPLDECDEASSFFQEELYEIGPHREVDPNEWNNLINDPDYQPVVNYLSQWLPDSCNYLKKTYTVAITNTIPSCLLNHTDTLHLSCLLYDPSGSLLSPTPTGLLFRWKNNFTSDVVIGSTIDFPLSMLPDSAFTSARDLLLYLYVLNNDTEKWLAFDIKKFNIVDAEVPSATFSVSSDGFTAQVYDYDLSGSSNSSYWDFGDGTTSEDSIPGPHNYAAEGTYTITNYVLYGNDTACLSSFSQTVVIDTVAIDTTVQQITENAAGAIKIYPTITSDVVMLIPGFTMDHVRLEITDATGKIATITDYEHVEKNETIYLHTAGLNAGMYYIKIKTPSRIYLCKFIKV